MSKLGSKEEILAAIQSHFENLQFGKLAADDLESLVELTRELHERALILRYKAYEEKIFGVRVPAPEPEPAVVEEPAPAETTEPEVAQHSMGFEEIETEMLEAEQAETPATADEPVFDFDMFEKAESNLFAPLAEPVAPSAPTIAEIPRTEAQQIADEIEESPVTVSEQMPIQEAEPSTPAAQPESKPTFVHETPIAEAPKTEAPQAEVPLPEELAIMNEPVITPEKAPEKAPENDMFRKFNNSNSDDSLSSRLMSTKLTTLVGAFGLNEKLMCIREMFKGSSEAFNQAIETLDQQENFAAAKRILAQYAQQNSWDLESNLIAEFIQKVERRFL